MFQQTVVLKMMADQFKSYLPSIQPSSCNPWTRGPYSRGDMLGFPSLRIEHHHHHQSLDSSDVLLIRVYHRPLPLPLPRPENPPLFGPLGPF